MSVKITFLTKTPHNYTRTNLLLKTVLSNLLIFCESRYVLILLLIYQWNSVKIQIEGN